MDTEEIEKRLQEDPRQMRKYVRDRIDLPSEEVSNYDVKYINSKGREFRLDKGNPENFVESIELDVNVDASKLWFNQSSGDVRIETETVGSTSILDSNTEQKSYRFVGYAPGLEHSKIEGPNRTWIRPYEENSEILVLEEDEEYELRQMNPETADLVTYAGAQDLRNSTSEMRNLKLIQQAFLQNNQEEESRITRTPKLESDVEQASGVSWSELNNRLQTIDSNLDLDLEIEDIIDAYSTEWKPLTKTKVNGNHRLIMVDAEKVPGYSSEEGEVIALELLQKKEAMDRFNGEYKEGSRYKHSGRKTNGQKYARNLLKEHGLI